MDQAPTKSRRRSKGMYILPSIFTTANMALGYYAILEVLHATVSEYGHLDNAAKQLVSQFCSTASMAVLRA